MNYFVILFNQIQICLLIYLIQKFYCFAYILFLFNERCINNEVIIKTGSRLLRIVYYDVGYQDTGFM